MIRLHSGSTGSRALGPGFRRALRSGRVWRLVAAGVCVVAVGACGTSKTSTYGGLPKFLPTTSIPTDRIVTASAEHPQLAIQGDTLNVDLPAGHVLATVVGPQVPPFVAPPPPAVTATFTVTFARATGTVPIRLGDFTIRDQLGRLLPAQLVTGEAPPPASAPAGTTMSFQVTQVLPTGEGRLQWAPGGGPAIASWDFVVEND